MNNQTTNSALTFEGLMASIHESNRYLTEKFAETDRLFKESSAKSDREFAEMRQQFNERDKKREKAWEKREKKREKEWEKREKEWEKRDEEWEKRDEEWAKYEKRMKRMENDLGAWSNNHGSFAEEYFINSFEDGEQNFFGEQFDEMEYCLKPKSIKVNGVKLQDEYDIVLYNHSSVAIIEVKFKAHENDIAKTMKKVNTFRILCPEYKDYKIYLGLASMSFYPEVEEKCNEQGIAIIKQVGDLVVINDAHLKVF